jgi:hypothetical protein
MTADREKPDRIALPEQLVHPELEDPLCTGSRDQALPEENGKSTGSEKRDLW